MAAGPLLGDRIERAIRDPMHVQRLAPGVYEVVTLAGDRYRVDVTLGACRCPDFEYRGRQSGFACKHLVRARAVHEGREVRDG